MEKLPIHAQDGQRAQSTAVCWRRDRMSSYRLSLRVVAAVLVCLGLFLITHRFPISYRNHLSAGKFDITPESDVSPPPFRDEGNTESHLDGDATSAADTTSQHTSLSRQRVPLEAHIMSKCPDAQDCLQQLIVPAMERISEKVDFTLSFIASVSNKSSEVECKHGPSECIGNMLILCAANLPFPPSKDTAAAASTTTTRPRTPVIRSLGFANCMIDSYQHIPERDLVETCASEHGIDFDALNRCASQQDDDDTGDDQEDTPVSGIALLRESALHSDMVGVTKSCTVRLQDEVWCIRDGAVWKDCGKNEERSKVKILVDEVEKLWKEKSQGAV